MGLDRRTMCAHRYRVPQSSVTAHCPPGSTLSSLPHPLPSQPFPCLQVCLSQRVSCGWNHNSDVRFQFQRFNSVSKRGLAVHIDSSSRQSTVLMGLPAHHTEAGPFLWLTRRTFAPANVHVSFGITTWVPGSRSVTPAPAMPTGSRVGSSGL